MDLSLFHEIKSHENIPVGTSEYSKGNPVMDRHLIHGGIEMLLWGEMKCLWDLIFTYGFVTVP